MYVRKEVIWKMCQNMTQAKSGLLPRRDLGLAYQQTLPALI